MWQESTAFLLTSTRKSLWWNRCSLQTSKHTCSLNCWTCCRSATSTQSIKKYLVGYYYYSTIAYIWLHKLM